MREFFRGNSLIEAYEDFLRFAAKASGPFSYRFEQGCSAVCDPDLFFAVNHPGKRDYWRNA